MRDKERITSIIMDFMGRENMTHLTNSIANLIVRIIETVSVIEQKAYTRGYSDGKRNREKLHS